LDRPVEVDRAMLSQVFVVGFISRALDRRPSRSRKALLAQADAEAVEQGPLLGLKVSSL
jgi:hypothetical protein